MFIEDLLHCRHHARDYDNISNKNNITIKIYIAMFNLVHIPPLLP